MAFGESCQKFFLSGANFTFSLGGLALLIVGILYKINFNHYTDAIPEDYQSIGLAPVLTIVIGAIIFVIAFFGCCGAFRENTCMLSTYAVILLIIFLMQIAIGVFIFVEIKNKDNFEMQVKSTLKKVFDSAFQNNKTELVDIIQKEIIGCVFSLCLSSSIKNRERRFRY